MPEEHEFFGEAPEPNQFDPLSFHETTQEDADRLYREAEAAPEPEQEAPQEQAEQPYNPILDSMRSKNYDVSNYSSDAELLNDLEGGHQIAAERQKMIDQQLQQLQLTVYGWQFPSILMKVNLLKKVIKNIGI